MNTNMRRMIGHYIGVMGCVLTLSASNLLMAVITFAPLLWLAYTLPKKEKK
ncbi:hypothetical protein [Vibrio phage vB_VpS_PG28]|nr:hypothetical protein [Vibrio phage vB_VpS_PG28]